MTSMLSVVLLVDDRGSTFTFNPSDSESETAEMNDVRSDESQTLQSTLLGQTISNYHSNLSRADSITSGQNKASENWTFKPDACSLLYAVQSVGWLGVCAQSFFWTSWRGDVVGCIDLALQAAIGMATVVFLPRANASCGAAFVWCSSELFFHLLMISVVLVPLGDEYTRSVTPRIIGALSGINYAVHATNALLVAADIVPDQTKRARTIAMVNNALPTGQLITALSGGAIAQYFGGFEYVFVCYGIIGALVTSVVWAYSSRHNLFSTNNEVP